jgi:hypothetical protein
VTNTFTSGPKLAVTGPGPKSKKRDTLGKNSNMSLFSDFGPGPYAKIWTLHKSEVVKMLMAMDRYKVSSVTVNTEPDYFNWQIEPAKKKTD